MNGDYICIGHRSTRNVGYNVSRIDNLDSAAVLTYIVLLLVHKGCTQCVTLPRYLHSPSPPLYICKIRTSKVMIMKSIHVQSAVCSKVQL